MTEFSADIETFADYQGPKGEALVSFWTEELDAALKREKQWRDKGKEVIKRYRDEDELDSRSRFSLLWSNVETLKPALMNKTPVPDIRRRHADREPVARVASEIAERAVSTNMDVVDYDQAVQAARDDRLLVGRGVCWIRYEPEYESDVDDEGNPYQRVSYETAPLDHVQWEDFTHGYARSWKHVPWVARRSRMTRTQLKKRFPETGPQVDLAHDDDDDDKEVLKRAEVWEIWDKETKRVFWICKTYKEGPLDVRDDFLHLKGFFPCPRPLYASMTPNSLIPLIDYLQYQDQAREIDTLTTRISLVTEAIKVRGAYDGSVPELGSLIDETEDNKLIPSSNWANLMSKGGLEGVIQFMPLEELAKVLTALVNERNNLLQQVYEITGIADIVRGASKASETATAQRIKGNFASLRLNEMQREVARFCRDCIRLMAEVVVEQFDPETLVGMSAANDISEVKRERMQFEQAQQQFLQAMSQPPQMGQLQPGMGIQAPQQHQMPTPPQPPVLMESALTMLQNDMKRCFAIDIETDSTIQPDEQAEKEARVEMLSGVTAFMGQAIPAAQQNPALVPLVGEMLLFTVRTFKAGRTLESTIEEMVDEARNNPPQPQPDPKVEVERAKLEIDKQRAQMDAENMKAKTQADIQSSQMKAQNDFQLAMRKMQGDMALSRQEMESRIQLDRERAAAEMQTKREIAQFDAQTRRLTAARGKAA